MRSPTSATKGSRVNLPWAAYEDRGRELINSRGQTIAQGCVRFAPTKPESAPPPPRPRQVSAGSEAEVAQVVDEVRLTPKADLGNRR